MENIKIGLFGLGVVGSSVFRAIESKNDPKLSVRKIAVKDIGKPRTLHLPAGILTDDPYHLLNDHEINVVIELINDADAAFTLVKQAFEKGKSVISANKKMIATHLEALLALQKLHGGSFYYEAAVCGSIPILRLLDQHFSFDQVQSFSAIANGTCNYILSKMLDEEKSYPVALKAAQSKGFAENDPCSDVSGADTRYKLSLMIYHAFGLIIPPQDIPMQGIERVDEGLLRFCRAMHCKVKLIAEASMRNDEVSAFVGLKFIPSNHLLFPVDEEENAVVVKAAYAGSQLFRGKGAGGDPTAMAVLSNLQDIERNQPTVDFYVANRDVHTARQGRKLYFIGGTGFDECNFTVLHSRQDFALVMASFEELMEEQQQFPALYWVSCEAMEIEKLLAFELSF